MPKEIEVPSETLPGASFVLQALGRAFRHRIEVRLAEVRYQTRLLLDQYRDIVLDEDGREKIARPLTKEQLGEWRKDHVEDPSLEPLSAGDREKLTRLEVASTNANEELRLAVARERLLRFTLPEEYADVKTKEDLFEFGPELFVQEIELKAQEGWLLSEAVRKNLPPPTSLASPEDGPTTITNAADASSATSTSPGTAS